jgi:hypothetical protein
MGAGHLVKITTYLARPEDLAPAGVAGNACYWFRE